MKKETTITPEMFWATLILTNAEFPIIAIENYMKSLKYTPQEIETFKKNHCLLY